MDMEKPTDLDQRTMALVALFGDITDLLIEKGLTTEGEVIGRLENLETKALAIGWPSMSETVHLALQARLDREALRRHRDGGGE
jgi:hypothetical protein